MIRLLSILLMLACVLPAEGSDAQGRYWVGGGAGGVMCPDFVASMENARSKGIGTFAYVNETKVFTMYILGFQTGYNVSTPNTCDIFSGDKGYELLSWVENYCRNAPTERFADAVVQLSEEFYSKRQQVCPW